MGPQGTGGLCIRPGVALRPLLRGGTGVHSYDREQPKEYPARLEAGTLNGHGLAGLHAALDFILRQGAESIGARERQLMRRFYEGVRSIPGVTVYGDFTAPERAAIVTLNIRDYDSAEIADILAEDYGIATRAGAHCAPRMHEALGTVQQGAVRFSFSFFNTEEGSGRRRFRRPGACRGIKRKPWACTSVFERPCSAKAKHGLSEERSLSTISKPPFS